MPPTFPFNSLRENIDAVLQLFRLHRLQTGTGPGRRHGVEVLNKSAIVLTAACWEAFIEDIATSGAGFLATAVPSPEVLPKAVRKAIACRLASDKNELAAWKLAGDAWQTVLRTHAQELSDAFHSPRADRVDELLQRTLGVQRISAAWTWPGMSSSAAYAKLDALLTLRGGLAHRVSAHQPVRKSVASDYAKFVLRLARRTSNVVRLHIHGITGRHPWPGIRLRIK